MSAAKARDCGGTIAVIGDLHSSWEVEDLGYFNRSAYPAILVTGDLGRSRSQDGRRIARSLMHLLPEVLVMPGNNDVDEYPHMLAELTYRRARADLLAETLLGEEIDTPHQNELARLCGYSLHSLLLDGLPLTIIAGRPFSMGGPELAFPDALGRNYGVHTLQESVERLKSLVDLAPSEHVVFFSHNGPSGLGHREGDIWGRDFSREAGDWGDPDLRLAIDYALERKLRILAVVAGHMHWQLQGRHDVRRWQLRQAGILYVNAARVPRVFEQNGQTLRHHIRLRLTQNGATAEECLVTEGGG
jgi:uncharacterized protein (TIGR04168 family)